MIDRKNEGQSIGEELLFLSDVLFSWWHRVRDGTLARATFQRKVIDLRRDVRVPLERGAACGCAKTAGACRDLLADEQQLWTFVRIPGFEPTNNTAERALRHAVLWRKSSFGTDSVRGSRFVERILSVAATCRQQRRNVLETLADLIQAHQKGQPTLSLVPPSAQLIAAA